MAHARARASQALWLGTALLLTAFVMCSSACGASARRDTLNVELAALDTARDAFVKWDRAHQLEIVAKATSRDEATAKLKAYRDTVQFAVELAFSQAYGAIWHAALRDDDASVSAAKAAVRPLIRGVRDLKPGEDPPTQFICGVNIFPDPPLTCDTIPK